MSSLKRKIGWFLLLIVGVIGLKYIGANNIRLVGNIKTFTYNYNAVANDITVISSGFFEALFMEAFVTIHMSVFVFIPLSKIFGKNKSKQLFWTLFIGRIIILLIGNLYMPNVMSTIDFFAVFIGAFLIVPISGIIVGLSSKGKEIFKVTTSFNYEVPNSTLSQIGFGDSEVLKKGLVQHYADIINYCNSKDYNSLIKLCSPGVYNTYKTEIELYEKVFETKVVENFICNRIIITGAAKVGQEIFIDIEVSYNCFEYVVDQYNNIVRGSNSIKKEYTKSLSFSKKLSNNYVVTCPNCNASINEGNVDFCSYCGTALNVNVMDWVLKNEKILIDK